MKKRDARTLNQQAQEELRQVAVKMIRRGETHAAVARQLGVHRGTVTRWWGACQLGGSRALRRKRRGRRRGQRRLLTARQERWLQQRILDRTPEQLQLPFALWPRRGVCALAERRFGVRLSERSMGNYLRRWGYSPQKPLKKAYEQNPAAVAKWLQTTYPRIRARAQAQGAEILWGDETGLRSEDQVGRSYAPKGRTPAFRQSGRRFRTNVISAINNQGKVQWMGYREELRAPVFVRFLQQLIKYRRRKVFLIADNHSAHRAAAVKKWLRQHRRRIAFYRLPAYSPELNPDEYLNNDLKQNIHRERHPKDQDELEENLWNHMSDLECDWEKVKRFFQHPKVTYAA